MKRMVTAGAVAVAAGLTAVAVANTSDAATNREGTEAFAVSHATSALRAHPADVAASVADEFKVRGTVVEPGGASHVKYDRTHKGLPVLGGEVIVHLDKAGAMRTMSAPPLAAPLSVSTTPRLTAAQAAAVATARFHGTGAASTPALAVDTAGTPRLVWQTVVPGVADEDGERGSMNVLVDAATGAIADAWPDHEHGTGTGFDSGEVTLDTTKSGSQYQLKDPKRGGNYTVDAANNKVFTDADDVWGDGKLTNRQTVAVDAQYGVAKTWDYYQAVHGRNGIAGDGRGSYSKVHYGSRYNNAFWSDACFCMTYGDGDGTNMNPLVSLDVAGHEMSHGVTSRTAGLRYSGESGGINEATSDIFGTMVEFYANNPNDVPDYLIGEKVLKNSKPLRYMDDPKRDGRSASCWTSTVGQLDVHLSSGVANHFFFTLAVGSGAKTVNGVAYSSPTCNGAPAVTGVGNAAAEKIWYRALTTYMTSTTNYKGARTATLKAATDLFGANSNQYKAVAAAWTAVAVN